VMLALGVYRIWPGANFDVSQTDYTLLSRIQQKIWKLANGNLYVIELDKDKINPYFLKAYLESESGKAALSRVAVGATLLNLPVEGLKKVIIPLPDLESQKKIADQYYAKLSEIKELKYKLEKATEELEHIYTEEK
jgi:restriction endonuclease S subunit